MVNDSTTILGKPPSPRMPSGSARRPQLDGTFPDAAAESPDASPSVSAVASTFLDEEPVYCGCSYGCWECDDTTEWRRV